MLNAILIAVILFLVFKNKFKSEKGLSFRIPPYNKNEIRKVKKFQWMPFATKIEDNHTEYSIFKTVEVTQIHNGWFWITIGWESDDLELTETSTLIRSGYLTLLYLCLICIAACSIDYVIFACFPSVIPIGLGFMGIGNYVDRKARSYYDSHMDS